MTLSWDNIDNFLERLGDRSQPKIKLAGVRRSPEKKLTISH